MASATSRCRARRSDWRYSSSQPRSSQRRPSYIEVSEASVLRSTSVSSMRRIIVPPLRRAYSQLKMNVRALPMCKKRVGEGAKRTLSMGNASITRVAKGLGDEAVAGLLEWDGIGFAWREGRVWCEGRGQIGLSPAGYGTTMI